MSSRTLFGLVLLLAIATAGPPSDAPQATRIPKIGFLGSATQAQIAPLIAAFKEGLRELDHIEGKTVLLEVRLAVGAVEGLPELDRAFSAVTKGRAKALGLTTPRRSSSARTT